jgi:methylenetetrahydrofolate dehydrogenase (NADP+) / methenyltetrahydrofolate cyclohydrolase
MPPMAELIRGAPIAQKIEDDVRRRAEALSAEGRFVSLAAVRAHRDPASELYIKRQQDAALRLGFRYRVVDAPDDALGFADAIRRVSADPETTGVIVQTPLPKNCDHDAIRLLVPPEKDVEAVHPANLGTLLDRDPPVAPCTAAAVIACVESTGTDLAGKHAVVVGRSRTVGRPAALLLVERNATVTVCHSKTRDVDAATRSADVVVLAVGRAGFLRAAAVKPGAVVVDVGINRVERDGKKVTVGDADSDVASVAAALTPVPGGVGPVTVAILWRNAVALAEAAAARRA